VLHGISKPLLLSSFLKMDSKLTSNCRFNYRMSEIAAVLGCLFLSSERGSFMFSAQFVLTNLGVSLCSLVFFFVGAFFPV